MPGEDFHKEVAMDAQKKKYELLGESIPMRKLRAVIEKAAAHPEAAVLITGESGTGKECVCRLLVAQSPRASKPLVAFNCASVNPEILSATIFGHAKNAFTGAGSKDEPGLIEKASGGTLFLDEIGELPYGVQATLLRWLECGSYMPIGGKSEIEADVRLICATNSNLERLSRDGKFRRDLLNRINVIRIQTPALRQHREDIPEIANAWLRYRQCEPLTEAQAAALMAYDFSGDNVRGLIGLLERARVLGATDYSALVQEQRELNALDNETAEQEVENLEAAMRRHVRRVFAAHGNNVTQAAVALGVSRNTVARYLKGE